MPDITVVPASLSSPEFVPISSWPLEGYVARLLRVDIPTRMLFSACSLWVYQDPPGHPVGFGTLDIAESDLDRAGGRTYVYIPLLAVRPGVHRNGYGTKIVNHLCSEAVMLVDELNRRLDNLHRCHDEIILDVYEDNTAAISLYTRCGFVIVDIPPKPDPEEDNRRYIYMARKIKLAAT